MSEMMTFPDTWEEFEKSYGFTDSEEVYTNGVRLIPSFRVKQWLDHLPSVQPDIDEFLRNKSPKEHREILHWIAIHYYPRDSKEVLQAVSNMVRPDMREGEHDSDK